GWKNEADRVKVLSEKHRRGAAARSVLSGSMKPIIPNDQIKEDRVIPTRLGTLMALEEQTSINVKRPHHQHKQHGMRVHLQERSGVEYTSLLNLTAIKPHPIHYRLVVDKFHINIK
ncbi:hypothetical protein A2U01_0033311, partial [Trifolium medium]|nr:hypothetical protein [Trifolium medium]